MRFGNKAVFFLMPVSHDGFRIPPSIPFPPVHQGTGTQLYRSLTEKGVQDHDGITSLTTYCYTSAEQHQLFVLLT